ncbi:hypothetical protein [Streptomyces chumphonensis]|uniref:hypothetical protein n=1 Tax=Streptomyces chumphonensis TaxID=1214925 RepID=UPI003D74018E
MLTDVLDRALEPRDEAALDQLQRLDTTTVGTLVRWLRARPTPPPDGEPGPTPRPPR